MIQTLIVYVTFSKYVLLLHIFWLEYRFSSGFWEYMMKLECSPIQIKTKNKNERLHGQINDSFAVCSNQVHTSEIWMNYKLDEGMK